MLWWEYKPVPISELETYDVGIVFSGVTRASIDPRDRIYFREGADRITHALQLYNQGRIKHIIVTGGKNFQQKSEYLAADRLKSFLTMAGVPDSAITVEREAVNTYENALKTKAILEKDFPNQKYLLITSAFHMRRSLLCMQKQEIEVKPFAAGFITGRPTTTFEDILVPKSESIGRWEVLIKEVIGIATYRIMGYL